MPAHSYFMAENVIPVFATPEDWALVLRVVTAQRDLVAVAAGMFNQPEIAMVELTGFLPPKASHLVMNRQCKVHLRAVPQRGGGVRFSIDQIENPQTVFVQPGSMVGNDKLVAGQVGTASDDPVSLDLLTVFSSALYKHFVEIKSYRVGPQAAALLDTGIRLASTENSPVAYDLRRH